MDAGVEIQRADSISGNQIFSTVKSGIEKSRFVVVKADADSKNVFFELGLAVSLQKEILIIIEQKGLKKIPSDLKDWRFLTYKKGDYRNLRRAVRDWFRSHYHLSGATKNVKVVAVKTRRI